MHTILVCDIGGTNCRFAKFTHSNGDLKLEGEKWLDTKSINNDAHLWRQMETNLASPLKEADAVVVAVAGDIKDGHTCTLTNGRLTVDIESLRKKYNIEHCRLINDFVAEAYSLLTFPGQSATPVSSASPTQNDLATGCRAIIGAGTGLGCSSLHHISGQNWLVAPSEGGHSPFPFSNNHEQDFCVFLQKTLKCQYISYENVLSGSGLELLHQFLTGDKLTAKEVAARALSVDTETLRWLARFFGRMSKNWILSTLCKGGLWITGGLAIRNSTLFKTDDFWSELYLAPKHEKIIRKIPIFLMNLTNSGLWGAAQLGRLILNEE